MKSYYFDYNATTPVFPEVVQAMEPYWSSLYANPSSVHQMARDPYKALRNARRQLASLLNIPDGEELVFTSGGSESNTLAIRAALQLQPTKKELITTSVEHSSVLKLFRHLEEQEGYTVSYVGVNSEGGLNVDELKGKLNSNVALVSMMLANNETGVLFPLKEIMKDVKESGAFFHIDAIQAIGKTQINLQELSADFVSVSAHKFYGPKGVGALYSRKGLKFDPLIWGGNQERGRRAGTENVPAVVGMGEAAAIVKKRFEKESSRLGALRDYFEKAVQEKLKDVFINGNKSERLNNTSCFAFEGVDGEALLMALDGQGICVSRGSACMSGAGEPSHVLTAMGLPEDLAKASMRFSFGWPTTQDEVNILVRELIKTVEKLRLAEKVI